ncbi:hypothetical protein IKW75_03280 [Candidatus Saccharibacteria bacterium]|nr:hypothetical protein [Candidatus Saccharibacteria bacterium]
MIKLTKKQQLVYNYIADYVKEKGTSPTYREVCAGLGLSSVSAVAEHIDNLITLGALRKSPKAARSLEVVDITYPETVALFRQRMAKATEEELEILRKSAKILGIDLSESEE